MAVPNSCSTVSGFQGPRPPSGGPPRRAARLYITRPARPAQGPARQSTNPPQSGGKAPGKRKGPRRAPEKGKGPRRAPRPAHPPPRGSRMRPARARHPVLPRTGSAVLWAMAGLAAEFGMGSGDPRLRGRARAGRTLRAPGFRGRPGGRIASFGRRPPLETARPPRRQAGEQELGLLVPLA